MCFKSTLFPSAPLQSFFISWPIIWIVLKSFDGIKYILKTSLYQTHFFSLFFFLRRPMNLVFEQIYYLFFSFILHLTYTYRLSIIVFLWIHNRVASDSGDRWGFVFFCLCELSTTIHILHSSINVRINFKCTQLKISVIKLMSFNTLALPKKLRDAFNREKTPSISFIF